MQQEDQELFEVRFTDEGKKYIRKFAAISYWMMVLLIFEAGTVIYWNVKSLIARTKSSYASFSDSLYNQLIPYLLIVLALLGFISGIYYLRFPHILIRSLDTKNEPGANRAFRLLFKGVIIWMIYLALNAAAIIWSFIDRQ